MFESFTLRKFKRQIQDMEQRRFVHMETLFPFAGKEDQQPVDVVHTQPETGEFPLEIQQGYRFVGRDRYLWLKKQVTIPESAPGLVPTGFFDFGKTGGGHNSGFESLLYIDGQPYQGVDSNHKEVTLEEYAGQTVELLFMLWTGMEGGGQPRQLEHTLQIGAIGYLHQDADDFHLYSKVISETLEYLPDTRPEYQSLLTALDVALLEIDWDEDCYHATVSKALAVLKEQLASIPKVSDVIVHCVGHTHIDVAWLWRLKHTREKSIRSFSTVLRFMKEHENYKFIQSQSQLYQYIKDDAPEIYAQMKERAAQGLWEADGGMWVEADCNVSSGESLSRQFLYGSGFFMEEFGRQSEYLWLPDVFGYSWALPQIMKQCGIKTFMTTKISWNEFNTMPNDLFLWRGIDGTEILTYFIDTPDTGRPIDDRFATYNGFLSPRAVIGSWDRFKNKELSNEVLISYGYGDGGGGPTREMVRMREVMDEMPGLPQVKAATPSEFFDRMHQKVEDSQRPVPIWDGELYLEYHRGTYTSQGAIKRWNRVLEHKLAATEYLGALAALHGQEYPTSRIYTSWQIVLRNQFHDIIPGSSIREVNEDAIKEYEMANTLLEDAVAQSLATLVEKKDQHYTVFSFSSFAADRLISLPVQEEGIFYLEETALPAQKTADGYQVLVPLADRQPETLRFAPSLLPQANSPFVLHGGTHTLETPFYSIVWDTTGFITSLYDKENDREVLKGYGNCLEVFEDKPLGNDNWNIEVYHMQKREFFQLTKAPEVVEQGALFMTLRFTYTYRQSVLTQEVTVYTHSRRIDFATTVDWQESHRLLKTAFDLNLRTTSATYDIQYGHAQRPIHQNTTWDAARFEVVGHKWADLSEDNYGVSLLNDCKYGYSALEGILRLTLLKSTKHPDTQADMGVHHFTYSLLPHAGSVTQGDTIAQSHTLNFPVIITEGALAVTDRILSCDSSAIIVDAVKQAEDGNGIILRLHESLGGSHKVELTALPERSVTVTECNIMEQPQAEPQKQNQWTAQFTPFEIKNYRITW